MWESVLGAIFFSLAIVFCRRTGFWLIRAHTTFTSLPFFYTQCEPSTSRLDDNIAIIIIKLREHDKRNIRLLSTVLAVYEFA